MKSKCFNFFLNTSESSAKILEQRLGRRGARCMLRPCAPLRLRAVARALCARLRCIAAACIRNSWWPGSVRGSPSIRPKRHIHALQGRPSTRSKRGRPRAPREVMHMFQGRRGKRFKGGEASASREAVHALQGRRSTRFEDEDPRTAARGTTFWTAAEAKSPKTRQTTDWPAEGSLRGLSVPKVLNWQS